MGGFFNPILGALRLGIFAPSLYSIVRKKITTEYDIKAAVAVLCIDTLLFIYRRFERKKPGIHGASLHDQSNKMANWVSAVKWLLP